MGAFVICSAILGAICYWLLHWVTSGPNEIGMMLSLLISAIAGMAGASPMLQRWVNGDDQPVEYTPPPWYEMPTQAPKHTATFK